MSKLWKTVKVAKIIEETYDTKTFILTDNEGNKLFKEYKAGQYINFRKEVNGVFESRSYTLSSAPSEDFVSVTIKKQAKENGFSFSSFMVDEVKENDLLTVFFKPVGDFYYNPEKHKKEIFLFSGGSGVTPCFSMLKEMSDRLGENNYPNKIHFVVNYKSYNDIIFKEQLNKFKNIYNINMEIILSFDQKDGYGSGLFSQESLILKLEPFKKDCSFFTCGPKGLMNMFVDSLKKLGVEDEHILLEQFS